MKKYNITKTGNINEKEVYLTFDDGPNPHATEKILKILDFYNIKATFFVLGKRCVDNPDILKDIIKKGHSIGNHTFSHELGDFEKCARVIKEISGIETNLIRPPFYNLSFLELEKNSNYKYQVITGEVDSCDYENISFQKVIDNVLSAVGNGSIIDFHDGSERDIDLTNRPLKTIRALPTIIESLMEKGYIFSTFN